MLSGASKAKHPVTSFSADVNGPPTTLPTSSLPDVDEPPPTTLFPLAREQMLEVVLFQVGYSSFPESRKFLSEHLAQIMCNTFSDTRP